MKLRVVAIGAFAATALALAAVPRPPCPRPISRDHPQKQSQPTISKESTLRASISRPRSTTAQKRSPPNNPPSPAPEGMVWIPGGTFWMGADDASMADAKPVHEVKVSGFWMDRTEVTNRQFARFVKADRVFDGRRAKARSQGLSRMHRPRNSFPARSSSHRRPAGFRSTIRSSGGVTSRAQTGGIPKDRQTRSREKMIIQSCRFAGTMQWPMRTGRASGCRPRPSGNIAARGQACAARYVWGDELLPGRKVAGEHLGRPLPRSEHSRGMVSPGRPRSARFPPTALACPTWPATSGNGAPTGIGRIMKRRSREPDGPGIELRSRRARRPQASPARRVVPVQRPILHPLSSRCPRQGCAG